jgi:cardiolipin synthase (CMP-forming)
MINEPLPGAKPSTGAVRDWLSANAARRYRSVMNRDNLTLPNLLTVIRILLVPLVVWRLLVLDMQGAFWLFAAAALTDLLDGSLARLLNQRTVLGAWLDPIADKLMLLSTLFMLAWDGVLPVYLALVVGLRDLVILSGAAAYRRLTGGLDVHPTLTGKLATFVEFILVALALADAALDLGLTEHIPLLSLLAAALVVLSGIRYVWIWADKTRAFLNSQQVKT